MTDTEQLEAWQRTTLPPRHKSPPPLGTGDAKKDARPLTHSQVTNQAARAQHGACVEHVKVEGLGAPVCILKGQDPDAVVAEARALAGVAGDA